MHELNEKDLLILALFRKNSRRNLTSVAKELIMPISTLFQKLKRYEVGPIQRYTALVNFNTLGYGLVVQVLVQSRKDQRGQLQQFLLSNPHINTLLRTSNGFDFMVEALFRNMQELHQFEERLGQYDKEHKVLFVLDSLRREAFLSDKNVVNLLQVSSPP